MQVEASDSNHLGFFKFNDSGRVIYDGTSQTTGNTTTVVETGDTLDTPFVFLDDAASVVQTITNFRVNTPLNNTLVLLSSDFPSLAQVLHNTTMSNGNATIHDLNNSNTSLTLTGVTKAQMNVHPHEFIFNVTGQFF